MHNNNNNKAKEGKNENILLQDSYNIHDKVHYLKTESDVFNGCILTIEKTLKTSKQTKIKQ